MSVQDALATIDRVRERRQASLLCRLFPDETTTYADGTTYHARELYTKHMEFFEAGATYRERCLMAANRVGKTFSAGGYECALHATGRYPHWWPGRRFKRPTSIWVAGKTNETTRDIIQRTLFGELQGSGSKKRLDGTGVVPPDTMGRPSWKQGVADLTDVVPIRHVSGGWSHIGLKSYQQGRGSFEGTAQDAIWLDEECPADVYGECLIRTATTKGIVMLTFTPLEGLTETVLQFMPAEHRPGAAA